jgi:ribosomal protein L37AE/L43A
MDEINRRLDSIFDKGGFMVVKGPSKAKGKTKGEGTRMDGVISVKDGYIVYQIDVRELVCQCMNGENMCNHLLFALYEGCKLEPFVISFLSFKQIKQRFIEHVGSSANYNGLNGKLEKDIMTFLNSNECGICLAKLSDKRYSYMIYECRNCRNSVHNTCMTKWLTTNRSNGCIYCLTTAIT